SYSVLDKLDHPRMFDLIEKCPDVQVQHPVHLLACDSDVERVQRIVLASPWPESIRKAQKVLFPNLVENGPYRIRYDFVFQRRDSQWSLPSIGFRDPDSPCWFRSMCPAVDSPVKIAQLRLHFLSIFFPPHSVLPRRSHF